MLGGRLARIQYPDSKYTRCFDIAEMRSRFLCEMQGGVTHAHNARGLAYRAAVRSMPRGRLDHLSLLVSHQQTWRGREYAALQLPQGQGVTMWQLGWGAGRQGRNLDYDHTEHLNALNSSGPTKSSP